MASLRYIGTSLAQSGLVVSDTDVDGTGRTVK